MDKKKGVATNFQDLGLSDKTLNLPGIKANKLFPAFVVRLVETIESVGTMLLGPWMKNLPYLDFVSLKYALDFIVDSDDTNLPTQAEVNNISGTAITVTELLALAEGLEYPDDYDIRTERVEVLHYFVSVEDMARRGIPVEVFYEKMSLDNIPSVTNDPPVIARIIQITE